MSDDKTTAGTGGMRDHAKRVLEEQQRQAAAAAAPADETAAAVDVAPGVFDASNIEIDFALEGTEIRVDQGIALRHAFPDSDSMKWALPNLLPRGKGARVPVAWIAGYADATEDGETALGPYVRAIGEFTMQSAITGERFQHTECYLPTGFAKALKKLLSAPGAGPVEIDAIFLLEVTGASVPIRYVGMSRSVAQFSPRMQALLGRTRLAGRALPRLTAEAVKSAPDAA